MSDTTPGHVPEPDAPDEVPAGASPSEPASPSVEPASAEPARAAEPDPVAGIRAHVDTADATETATPAENAAPAERAQVVQTSAASPAGRERAVEAIRRQNGLAALGLALLVVALAFGAGFAIGRASAPTGHSALVQQSTPGSSPAPGASDGASPGASPSSLPSDGPRLGNAGAPVTIDYWADFQCPFCARFAQQLIPQLTSRIEAGNVALVHRDFAFLGAELVDAAVAVRCAGRQDRYWPMHDAVYAAQQGENQGAFSRDRLEQIADSIGLDMTAFAACLDDRAPLVEVLDDTAAGVRAGIQSTPTIDVNGTRFLGVPDVARFLAAIDEAAAGASPGVLPTPAPTNDPWSAVTTSGREAGDPGAPVTVELWMDYQAPTSATIVNDLEPELRTRVEAGRVRVVQRDLALLGDESIVAATTVRCIAAQNGPAWLAHDAIASAASGAGSGIFTPQVVLRFGARLGLDVSALSTCIDDPSVTAAVRSETAEGSALGLTAGPAVIVKVNGTEISRFTGDLDPSAILKAIDAAG